MSGLRILYLCHNDPRLHPGGTEIFARELLQEVQERQGVQAMFVAGVNFLHRPRRAGTTFQTVDRSANELLLWNGLYDRFFQFQGDILGVFPEFIELLKDFRPHIVHFHHLLMVGTDAINIVRRTLPDARIVMTLHDYYPICYRDGVMVKTANNQLCSEASPQACHGCFPDIKTGAFRLREVNMKNHLRLVDLFLSPSAFLRERYITWGIQPERIQVLHNGRRLAPSKPPRVPVKGERRTSFAVFGNVNPFKGAKVAIEAARLLAAQGETGFTLTIYGGTDFQTDEWKAEFKAAVDAAPSCVFYQGKYDAAEVPNLIADADWVIVPSIWWENAPLTIQEAFHHGRPVICSNIGGMAEAVRDGVDGLHFRVGDPLSLARVMRQILQDETLWNRLSREILGVRSIAECADEHLALYQELLTPAAVNTKSLKKIRPKLARGRGEATAVS
jgi:glycosyltransferase involved in cell wall biosynthesis